MESMQVRPERSVMNEWYFARLNATIQQTLREKPGEVQNFLNYLWPVALPYYSPLNPCYLVGTSAEKLLSQSPVWFARDGLIPLLWFFRQNPEPLEFQGRLWVQESLEQWVPNAWRKSHGLLSNRVGWPAPQNSRTEASHSRTLCRYFLLDPTFGGGT